MTQWHSFSDFIAMDGYGLYIWGAYGVTFLCMVIEPLRAVPRRRPAGRDAHLATHSEQEES
jgi:heme exporter protein D